MVDETFYGGYTMERSFQKVWVIINDWTEALQDLWRGATPNYVDNQADQRRYKMERRVRNLLLSEEL